MKILKIFGVVVAIHAIAFIVIFANPGCRSTSSSQAAEPVAAVPASTYSGGDDYVPVTPVSMDASPAVVALNTSEPAEGRFTPTRPGEVTESSAEVIPASSYTVQRGDSLWSIAKKNGISVAELASANNIKSNSTLQIGQKLLVPSKSLASTETGATTATGTKGYIVKSGDTLSTIASRHGTTIAAIRAANSLKGDMVRVGQELRIPDGSVAPPPSETAPVASTTQNSSGASVHVVKMGDTLGAIARRYKVTVSEIARANNITDPTKILIGQELVIPGAGASSGTPPPASTATTMPAQPPPAVPVQTVPTNSNDLDSQLPPDFIDAPVIQVEETGAPRVE